MNCQQRSVFELVFIVNWFHCLHFNKLYIKFLFYKKNKFDFNGNNVIKFILFSQKEIRKDIVLFIHLNTNLIKILKWDSFLVLPLLIDSLII